MAIDAILGGMIRPFTNGMSSKALPRISGKLTLDGLSGKVTISRDEQGVPHIKADSLRDVIFAQGFVHAQDRLWQLEINRRIALGKLSEIFGEAGLETDRAARTLGFHRLGEQDWELASPEMQEYALAYACGINAAIDQTKSLPPEFKLLKINPSKWDPKDVLKFSRVMYWQMSFEWYGEWVRAMLIGKVGPENAAELDINYPGHNPVELPKGVEFNRRLENGVLEAMQGPFMQPMGGSNAWAISGKRSTTGKPILANDPHLMVSNPSVWYQVHLQAGDTGLNVAGTSLPGIPMVIIGHNQHIAWGVTLAYTDVNDMYVERFTNSNLDAYEYKGKHKPTTKFREEITVKGREKPHVEEVVLTHHGPVVSGFVDTANEKLTLSSGALQPCTSTTGIFQLNHAKNWDEFVGAMRHLSTPALNIVYADNAENIGYWVSGRVPVREGGEGLVPSPGWTGDHEWNGWVPFEEMPHAFNPKKGYVLTCNHKIVGEDYPHFLGNIWMNGYRAGRLSDFFAVREKLSPKDCETMQNDLQSLPGGELLAHFRNIGFRDHVLEHAREVFCDWDRVLDPNSAGGAIYEVVKNYLYRNLVEPVVGEELRKALQGLGPNPALSLSTTFSGHDITTLLRLLNRPDSWWIQQAGGKEKLLKKSFSDAINYLSEKLGAQPENWKWGDLHQMEVLHILGMQKPLNRVFNIGPFPIGGDAETPAQAAFQAYHDQYGGAMVAASWRQIIDLGDLSQSKCVLPPGQSGNPKSPWYGDQMDAWCNGKYNAFRWTEEQINSGEKARLVLEPGKN